MVGVGTSVRVVIVEDEWLIAAALRGQMESQGYQVVGTAGTEAEALDLCSTECPDLVLMDVQMPEMDGLKATRALMERWPTCVVIVTGNGQLDGEAAQAGAMSYVVKPLLASQIPRVVEAARHRFDQYVAVYRQSGSPREALQAWQSVRRAVQALAEEEETSEDMTLVGLQRAAAARGVSLAAAAEGVLTDARPKAEEPH